MCRYVNKDEDAAVCYLSIDRNKRGLDAAGAAAGPVLVVHTGVPWSLKHHSSAPLEEEPAGYRATVEAEIMDHVKGLVRFEIMHTSPLLLMLLGFW